MSYCRMGVQGSTVYLYHDGRHYCGWAEQKDFSFETAQETLAFLEGVIERGGHVPDYAMEDVRLEAAGLRKPNDD